MRAGTAVVLLAVALCHSALGKVKKGKKGGDRLQAAVNEFSVDLLKDLFSGEPRNLVVSPVSASMLLAMINQGAKGRSAKQIESAIHLSRGRARLLYGRLSHSLQEQQNSSAKLEAANHVFVVRKFSVRPKFSKLLKDTFQSGIERTTFGKGDGANAINGWVRNATHGAIENIVDPVLSSEIAMVIINAMYFQSPWLKPFKTSSTSDLQFNLLGGSTVTVPFMSKREVFNVGELSHVNASWIELPFLGEQYSVVVVIPNEVGGLPMLVQNISAADIANMISRGDQEEVHLSLPRFSLSTKTDLIPPLKKLGIKDIFDEDLANLAGVSKKKLMVSKAVQRAEMKIDEAGGLAAAATGFELEPRSFVSSLSADRPFLAMVVDKVRRLPLFLCTVVDPSRT